MKNSGSEAGLRLTEATMATLRSILRPATLERSSGTVHVPQRAFKLEVTPGAVNWQSARSSLGEGPGAAAGAPPAHAASSRQASNHTPPVRHTLITTLREQRPASDPRTESTRPPSTILVPMRRRLLR